MGNKVLIIVIVAFIVISGLIFQMRNRTFNISEQTTEKFNQLQARYIANSAMEITLNKLRLNKSYRGESSEQSLFGGIYSVSMKGYDTLLISVTSKYYNQKSKLSVSAIFDNISLPPIKAGISISSSNLNLKLNGNISINGNDKNPDGTPGTSGAVYGIAVEDVEDSARIISNLSDNIKPHITGLGNAPSIGVNPTPVNINELIYQYIQSADIVLRTGTYSTGTTLGTPSEPKITYISGNATFSGNASGAGILIIFGDMSCAGNFNYQGLVIVFGNTAISASASGNSSIYGGLLVIGPSVDISATGSAIINYSSSVLKNIENKLKSSKFIVANWVDW